MPISRRGFLQGTGGALIASLAVARGNISAGSSPDFAGPLGRALQSEVGDGHRPYKMRRLRGLHEGLQSHAFCALRCRSGSGSMK